jgi:hypothetical protein
MVFEHKINQKLNKLIQNQQSEMKRNIKHELMQEGKAPPRIIID